MRILMIAAFVLAFAVRAEAQAGAAATDKELRTAGHGDLLLNTERYLFISGRDGETIWVTRPDNLAATERMSIEDLATLKLRLVRVENPVHRSLVLDAVLRAIPLKPREESRADPAEDAKKKGPGGQ